MTVIVEGSNLGPYRILEQIGEGGMATVYKAYQPSMDRYVAIKVLPPYHADDPQFIERFTHEARVIAKLEHQNILPVYDFGEEDSISYLVMRYLEGGTLTRLMKYGRLSLIDIGDLFKQTCAGLDYAHRQGVIHRDVKPANVMIDTEGAVYLTDFGIAKVLEGSPHLTATGTTIGTPTYMAPEQSLAKNVDARSDTYSLGVILYEMVVGKVPYEADTPMAVALAHIHDPLPLPRSIDPSIPEAIENSIIKAMAKEPDDRYQTANEFSSGLTNAIQDLDKDQKEAGEKTLVALATGAFEGLEETSQKIKDEPLEESALQVEIEPIMKVGSQIEMEEIEYEALPETMQEEGLALPTIKEDILPEAPDSETGIAPKKQPFPVLPVAIGIGGIASVAIIVGILVSGVFGGDEPDPESAVPEEPAVAVMIPAETNTPTKTSTSTRTPIPPTVTPTPLSTTESGLTIYDDFNAADGRIDTDRWSDGTAKYQIEDSVLKKRVSKGNEPISDNRFTFTDQHWSPRESGTERLSIETKILMDSEIENAGMSVSGLMYLQGPENHYFAIGNQWDPESRILQTECHGGDPNWNGAFHRIGNRSEFDSWDTFRFSIEEKAGTEELMIVGYVNDQTLCKFQLSDTWQQAVINGEQMGLTLGVWWDEAWKFDEDMEIWFDDVAVSSMETTTPSISMSETELMIYDDFNVANGPVDPDRWGSNVSSLYNIENGVLNFKASRGETSGVVSSPYSEFSWIPLGLGKTRFSVETKMKIPSNNRNGISSNTGSLAFSGPADYWFTISISFSIFDMYSSIQCGLGDPEWNDEFSRKGPRITFDEWHTLRFDIQEDTDGEGFIVVGFADEEEVCTYQPEADWQEAIQRGDEINIYYGVWWDGEWPMETELGFMFDDAAVMPLENLADN